MYTIYMDGDLLCNSKIEELALVSPVVSLKENSAGTFEFVINPLHPKYDKIVERKSTIQVYRDNEDEPTFSGIVIRVKMNFYRQKSVYCEGDLTYLNDSIQRQAVYHDITPRGLLTAYINSHNEQVETSRQFEVGAVTIQDNNNSLYRYTNMNTTMQEIKEDLIDDLGGIVRIRHVGGHRYIDILADAPHDCSQPIRLGENLIDFNSNLDTTEVATVIIPLGAKLDDATEVEGLDKRLDITSVNSGMDYVESTNAIARYGRISRVVTWDNVTTATALKSKAEKYMSDAQFADVVLEVKAVDLYQIDKSYEKFTVSDNVLVISEPHGMNRKFRLTELTIHLDDPGADTVTLGKKEKLSLSARTANASAAVQKAVEKITPPSKILQEAKDNATALITSAMGGYVYKTESELYIMDNPDPQKAKKVWRWNLNGLGYSASGVNGTYETAMTMDGAIVANCITAGILRGIKIIATQGSVGGWTMSPDGLSSNLSETFQTITSDDIARINAITLGNVIATDNDYEKYDYTTDGIIDMLDMIRANNLMKGKVPYLENGYVTIDPTSLRETIVIQGIGNGVFSKKTVIGYGSVRSQAMSAASMYTDRMTLKSLWISDSDNNNKTHSTYDGTIEINGRTYQVRHGVICSD